MFVNAIGVKILDAILGAAVSALLDRTVLSAISRCVKDRHSREGNRAVNGAYGQFARKYPNLAASFFDSTFLTSKVVLVELAKLLTPEEVPSTSKISECYANLFSQTDPDVTQETEYFVSLLRKAVSEEPSLRDIWQYRLVTETHENVSELKKDFSEFRDTYLSRPDEPPSEIVQPANMDVTTIFGRASQNLLNWPDTVRGHWIERAELDQLRQAVKTDTSVSRVGQICSSRSSR